jgi:hypothetical protein
MRDRTTHYFDRWDDAAAKLAELLPIWPHARIVEYHRGYAVQYYRSGPYWPAPALVDSRFNPANWT